MLTKNKFATCSMKRWTVAAFLFFAFFFHADVNGQESHGENAVKTVSSSEFTITSSSTDQEIAEKVAFYQSEFGLSLNVKNITRTDSGEINGIKMVFSNAKGAKQAYNVFDAAPIEPIRIYVDISRNNKMSFGFGDSELDADSEGDDAQTLESTAEIKEEPPTYSEQKSSLWAAIPEIIGDDTISLIKQDRSIDYKKAYISLDGKEISAAEMELINPASIGSVNVMNSANNDRLVEKFGEKARNGVIAIETQVVLEELTSDQISKLPENFKLDATNGAFIIHKKTTDSDLKFYEKKLVEIGVTLETSSLERNSAGDISNLKLKLHDDLQQAKMSDWIVYRNANGIINIVVGRKNGKASVYSQ